jgi:hypothetical protein
MCDLELSEKPLDASKITMSQRLTLLEDAHVLLSESIDRIRLAIKGTNIEMTVENYLIPQLQVHLDENHGFIAKELNISELREMIESEPCLFCPYSECSEHGSNCALEEDEITEEVISNV